MTHYQQSGLKARRAELVAQAQAIVNHNERSGNFPAADKARFDELMSQIDRLSDEINLGERVGGQAGREDIRLVAGRHHEEAPDTRAFNNYLRNGLAGLDYDDKAIMMKRYQPNIQAAQGVGTGSSGGFAVPDEAMRPLVEAMKLVGGLLPFATIIPSETGAALPIPTDNETAVEGAIVDENQQHAEQDITLASVTLDSFLYSSKIVRVSVQLMDDAGFNFGEYVMRKLGERIGRITAKHWVTGDGSSKPRGIVTAAPVGKVAASATAVTYDELVDLLHSVDPIYRQNGTWVMSDTTFAALRKLKDGQSRPLYGELANAEPNMLLGHKISIDPNMPAMATGNKSILFGDLKNYYVRIVKQPRVLRLEERFAEFGQLGFLSFLRADGDLVDGGGGAVKALQQA